MLRLLAVLGFATTIYGFFWVVRESQQVALQAFKGTREQFKSVQLKVWGLRTAMLVITFLQFYLLTGVFPVFLILALIGASVFAMGLYFLIGSIVGFALPEKQQKILALETIFSFQSGVQDQAKIQAMGLGYLGVLFASWIASVGIFWRYPVGDPHAKVLMALLVFTLPAVAASVVQVWQEWPKITSEYVDDDLRNSWLVGTFSNIVFLTIYLLFPVWILRQEVQTVLEELHWALPPLWILASVPLMIFMLGGVLPFFVGVPRYRIFVRALLEWRKRWLNEFMFALKLPPGQLRSDGVDERLAELNAEIERRVAGNDLLKLYKDLEEFEKARGDPDVTAMPQGVAEVVKFVEDNSPHLREWDIRFSELSRLQQLAQVTPEGKSSDISGSIDLSVKMVDDEIAARSRSKNILGGTIVGVLSVVIPWLFRTFQADIFRQMARLAR